MRDMRSSTAPVKKTTDLLKLVSGENTCNLWICSQSAPAVGLLLSHTMHEVLADPDGSIPHTSSSP